MKNLLPIAIGLIFLCANVNSFAAIHIVDNNAGSTAQYTDIGLAFTAAAAGDTIYVIGSPTPYSCFTWNKKMHIIGSGHRPQKHNSLGVTITGCGPNIYFRAGSTGSSLIGVILPSTNHNIWVEPNIDSLTFTGNSFFGAVEVEGGNYIIENNVFSSSGDNLNFIGTNNGNILISNNVFSGVINNAKTPTVEITNNIFLRNGNVFSGVENASIKNNIFHNGNPAGSAMAYFENNITYLTTDTLPTAGNFGTGNINSADPLFVNLSPTAYKFSYGHDYNLKPGSPGINAGTDGKDIGVYGGSGAFRMGGGPSFPMIKIFSIKNPVVPPNGNLEIKIEAETQN